MSSVLITGATGKQGGAVVSALLESSDRSNLTIRALTRNPSSATAQSLTAQNVQMVKGDLLDHVSLVKALRDVDVAFLVTDFTGEGGTNKEIKQGETFFAAAKEAGTRHIVFTSVQSADRALDVPHFASKFEIEKKLKSSGLQYTILRPVCFMDNIPTTSAFGRFAGVSLFNSVLGPKWPVQWVSVEDIGKVAAHIIASPQQYVGQTIDLAGDDLTVSQVQDAFKRATGTKPWRIWVPRSLVTWLLGHDFKMMVNFWITKKFNADVPALKKQFPGLLSSFEDWARRSVKNGKV